MSSIVAGRFSSITDAEEAARKLYARGFSVWDVSIMSNADGGVMLAARAKGERRREATEVLRNGGGKDVEHVEGKWEGGQWVGEEHAPVNGAAASDEAESEPWPAPASNGRGERTHDDGKTARHPDSGPVAEEAVAEDSTGNEDPGSELEHFVDHQVASHS